MARGSTRRDNMVLVRIRRMGKQWATCGIGVRPPEDMVGTRGMKQLCPKLVPGQCRQLPMDHPILRKGNAKLVEIVQEPEDDEFICPWVFKSAADAVSANPSKSHLTADQIAEGLALTEGATFNQRKKLEERERAAREVYDDETPVRVRGEKGRVQDELEDDEDEMEDDGDGLNEDVNARRSQNKHVRETDEDEAETPATETPARAPRRRPGRAART